MTEKNDATWIKASIAYDMLSGFRQDPTLAATTLAAYLRDGKLAARAKAIWRSNERFPSSALKSAPEDVEGGAIPVTHWRHEKNMIEDRAQWRWVASRFAVTARLKPRQRIMMRGVEFNLDDLIKLQPDVFRGEGKKRGPGRPPNVSGRDYGWLEVLDLALRGELNRTAFQTQTELLEHLKGVINKGRKPSRLGENQIAEIVRLAYPRLLER